MDDLPECDEMGVPEDGGGFEHRREDREADVRSWLLRSADCAAAARKEWEESGIALLRVGVHFSAVRVSADLVHAVASTDEPTQAGKFLDHALHGGSVFVDQHRRSYYVLVPPSGAIRYFGRRFAPAVEALGANVYIGVPRPEFNSPEDHFSHWVVPIDGPGDLCPDEALWQLVVQGAHLLAASEANDAD